MKHISEIIAAMPDEWKAKYWHKVPGETDAVNGAEIIVRMAAAGELAFLDRVEESKKGKKNV